MEFDLKKYVDLSNVKLEAYRLLSQIDNKTGFPYNLDMDDLSELKSIAKKDYKIKRGGAEEEVLVFLV
jgi:hypothetical protein